MHAQIGEGAAITVHTAGIFFFSDSLINKAHH